MSYDFDEDVMTLGVALPDDPETTSAWEELP